MARTLQAGATIGEYRVTSQVSEGAKACTYIGTDRTGSKYFLKHFHSPGRALPWFDRFIEHQRSVHEALRGSEVPGRFVTMQASWTDPVFSLMHSYEYIDGCSDLSSLLPALVADSDGFTRLILARVLSSTVSRMHRAGVAHLDLKPANVLLRRDDTVRTGYELLLIDFDFAILDGEEAPWPLNWGWVGTEGYQSPEHFGGAVLPSSASDVFTLAIMLYELLGTGHPWEDASPEADHAQITRSVKPRRLEPSANLAALIDHQALAELLLRALSANPSERPTASELHATLLRLPSGDTTAGPCTNPAHSLSAAVVAEPPKASPLIADALDETPPARESRERERGAVAGTASIEPEPVRPSASASRRSALPQGPLSLLSKSGVEIQVPNHSILGRERLRSLGQQAARISREQLMLRKHADGGLTIQHCYGAPNPTVVGDTPLEPGVPMPLLPGDSVAVISREGEVLVEFTVVSR